MYLLSEFLCVQKQVLKQPQNANLQIPLYNQMSKNSIFHTYNTIFN